MASVYQRMPKHDHFIVAAIDIGTTNSGYAYSLESRPTKMFISMWVSGLGISVKTPSVLLLNPDKTLRSFGYEAEDIFGDLVADGEGNSYYYFRSFKTLLYDSQRLVSRDMLIEDITGKKLRAILVFSLFINCLKKHLIDNLNKMIERQALPNPAPKLYQRFLRQTKLSFMTEVRERTRSDLAEQRSVGLKETDITWVLTVPAIWDDEKQQFMREAAQMAGISKEKLIIASKPEAASLFCMQFPVDEMYVHDNASRSSTNISPFQPGNKYMVVDVGACYVDITVYQVVDSDKLREMYLSSIGACGGRLVNEAFKRFLIRLLGDTVYEKFEMEHNDDFAYLYRGLECMKRRIAPGKGEKNSFKIPVTLFNTFCEVEKKKLTDKIEEFKDKLTISGDKLRIDASLVRSWFDEPIKKTVEHVQKLFQHQTGRDVSTILLVGGFSNSPMFQDAMRKTFKDKKLIIPKDAEVAVLKGSVIFGHNPVTIVPRVAEFSYGVLVYRNFQDGVHPNSKKTNIAGKMKCKDVFATIVKKGQKLVEGKALFNRRYTPLEANQMTFIFDVYKSPDEEPKFITDPGCIYVGKLEVEVPDLSGGKERGVWVQMIYTDNEFVVEARDEKTGKITTATLQDYSQSSDAE